MYLYSFDKFAGPDRVFKVQAWNEFCKKIKIWDLLRFGNEVFVWLWDDVSFSEQYTYSYQPRTSATIIRKWFLSGKAVHMVHRMVYTYYSTYKSVIKYFVSDEWEKLLGKEIKAEKKEKKWQTLVVYPDLRTISNSEYANVLGDKDVAFLSSTSSQWLKDKQRWAVKKWNVNIIFASPSEIFHDFYDLKKIIFIDPHKWYYANQQDPRYKVAKVLEEMKNVYWAELELAWV